MNIPEKYIPLAPHIRLTLDGERHSAGLSLTLTWSVEEGDARILGTLSSRVLWEPGEKPVGQLPVTKAKFPLERETRLVCVIGYRISPDNPMVIEVDLASVGTPIITLEPEGYYPMNIHRLQTYEITK